MKTVIAIDPGGKGGIAWSRADGYQNAVAMPQTNGDLLKLLRNFHTEGAVAYIEHVVGFIPGGGAGAMFTFGEGFGYLQGCMDTLGFRVIRVRPQQWQKALHLGGKPPKIRPDKDAGKESRKAAQQLNSAADREWKRKLKEEAQRRFPALSVTLATADALLLLDYAISIEK